MKDFLCFIFKRCQLPAGLERKHRPTQEWAVVPEGALSADASLSAQYTEGSTCQFMALYNVFDCTVCKVYLWFISKLARAVDTSTTTVLVTSPTSSSNVKGYTKKGLKL